MDPNSQRIQALKIESSMFKLTQICFDKCTEEINFYKISNLPQEENRKMYTNFENCLKNCTVAMAQTRDYVKLKLLQDIDSTAKKNKEIYKDFYT